MKRRTPMLLLVGALLAASGVAILAYSVLAPSSGKPVQYIAEVSSMVVTPTATPIVPPTPEATPASTAPIARVQIPDIKVDANVISLGLNSDGSMQDPKGPKDVAWYTFSARPGYTGNIVMAGHVDYINYGPAVFWNLRDLKPGEPIVVTLQDGSTFTYSISSVVAYDEATAPVQEIVGPTQTQSITLITCTGVFSQASHDYNKRLVVRGERIS